MEQHTAGEKRSQLEQFSSSKKTRFSSGNSKKGEILTCSNYGNGHSSKCKFGSKACYKCRYLNHNSFECKKLMKDV